MPHTLVPRLLPETGDRIVADDQVLHIRQADRAVPDLRSSERGGRDRRQQRVLDGIAGDIQVDDHDDFLDVGQVEESRRPDAASAHVTNAVALNLDIEQWASGDDRQSLLVAGSGASRLQRSRCGTGAGLRRVRSDDLSGLGLVRVCGGEAAQGDAVPCAVPMTSLSVT